MNSLLTPVLSAPSPYSNTNILDFKDFNHFTYWASAANSSLQDISGHKNNGKDTKMKALDSRGWKDKNVFRGIWEAEKESRDNIRKQKPWKQDLIQTMRKTRKTGKELCSKVEVKRNRRRLRRRMRKKKSIHKKVKRYKICQNGSKV